MIFNYFIIHLKSWLLEFSKFNTFNKNITLYTYTKKFIYLYFSCTFTMFYNTYFISWKLIMCYYFTILKVHFLDKTLDQRKLAPWHSRPTFWQKNNSATGCSTIFAAACSSFLKWSTTIILLFNISRTLIRTQIFQICKFTHTHTYIHTRVFLLYIIYIYMTWYFLRIDGMYIGISYLYRRVASKSFVPLMNWSSNFFFCY